MRKAVVTAGLRRRRREGDWAAKVGKRGTANKAVRSGGEIGSDLHERPIHTGRAIHCICGRAEAAVTAELRRLRLEVKRWRTADLAVWYQGGAYTNG